MACTILLADDAAYIRSVLRIRLELEDGFEIVAEAEDGSEAIHMASLHQPDVVIIDNSMPVMTGLEAIPGLKRVSPGTKVVMFSSADDSVRREALKLGADAFVSKSEPLDACIEEVADGCKGRMSTANTV